MSPRTSGRPQPCEIVGERQDLPGPADDLGAVGGELHARAAAQEDPLAEQSLDAAQLGTHRRLGVSERRSSPADAPASAIAHSTRKWRSSSSTGHLAPGEQSSIMRQEEGGGESGTA